jgi:hypothetical protein
MSNIIKNCNDLLKLLKEVRLLSNEILFLQGCKSNYNLQKKTLLLIFFICLIRLNEIYFEIYGDSVNDTTSYSFFLSATTNAMFNLIKLRYI